MSKYRKAWIAAAGALAQIAVVLDQALTAGTLPPSWVPWVRVFLAVLTAVGVFAVRNAPATYVPRHGDAGTTGAMFVTLVGFTLAGLLVVATLLAGPAQARRQLEHVGVASARACSGTLVVAFNLEVLRGGVWAFQQDDGAASVQLRHQDAAAGPGGHWETVASAPGGGGEGRLRVPVAGLPYWDAVRVVHHGVASSPRLPEEGCPG